MVLKLKKPKIQQYNDGVVSIFKSKKHKSSFGSEINDNSLDDMDFVVKLDFEELSKREEDIEFAEMRNCELSMKIRCVACNSIDTSQKALIGNVLYSIFKIDFDKSKHNVFIYLAEERHLKELS